jgi:multidrug efflux pump subunit AcrA (membrane-fusion protein)
MKAPSDEFTNVVGRRRGVRSVGVLVAVSVLSGGIGWVASRQLRSPADVAARTNAPAASRIVAPVEFRVLRSTLFTRGTVRFGSPRVVTLPASAIKGGSLVVTKPPTKGVSLQEGSNAGDVGGRPVIVLEGETPMYRDIRPGDRGADVESLKQALTRLGFKPGKGDLYDGATQKAVTGWMRKSGYEPFGPTDVQADRLKVATDAVRKAREQVAAAQLSVSKGRVVVTPDKVLAADEAVQSAVDRAEAARTDQTTKQSASELAIAQKNVAVSNAAAAVSAAELALQKVQTDVSGELSIADAEQALKAAQVRVVDADAAVTKAAKAAEVARADAEAVALEIPNAEAALKDAQGAVTVASSELERQKQKPAPGIEVAPGTLKLDQESKDQAVRAAEAALIGAQAGVRAAEASLRAAQRAAQKAADAATDASAALDPLIRAAATAREQVPIAELRLKQARQGGSSGAGSSGAGGGAGSSAPVGVVQAQQQLDQARATVVLTQRELEELVKSLRPTQNAAASAVRAADAQVVIAKAQRAELSKPQDLSTLQATLTAAQAAQREAQADLGKLESVTGIVVPANEVLFFPRLPLRVDDTKLIAGDALSGAFMTVASQRLAIDSSVDPADATGLAKGQKAEIEVSDLNIKVQATIARVATQTGTNGVDASRIYVELVPVDEPTKTVGTTTDTTASTTRAPNAPPDLADLNGVSVKVTIPISTTAGEVLVVPTAAVSAAVDGTTRIEVEDDPDKPTRFVSVSAGLRSEGFVQVTPITESQLKKGDLVVTGNRNGELLKGTPGVNDKSSATPDSVSQSSDTTAPSNPADTNTSVTNDVASTTLASNQEPATTPPIPSTTSGP